MNLQEFLAETRNREAVRDAVLRVQAETAPEEMEVTSSYVDPLLELAAQNRLPLAATSEAVGAFGAVEWMLPAIVSLVSGVLAACLATGPDRERWVGRIELEIEAWVQRSGSPRVRELLPKLARSLKRAFLDYLIDPFWFEKRSGARERRQIDISCLHRVSKGVERFSLVVRLSLGAAPLSAVTGSLDLELERPVRVALQAQGFLILNAPWQELGVPVSSDGFPAVFDLRPELEGGHSLVLDFYQDRQFRAAVSVPVEVVGPPSPDPRSERISSSLLSAPEGAPPDRTLRINWEKETQSLSMTLVRGGAAWFSSPAWRMSIPGSPLNWTRRLFQSLNAEAGGLGRSAAELEDTLRRIGQNLWRELPVGLKDLYLKERQSWTESSLLIVSDEPYIPWELVWPFGGGEDDSGPWCQTLFLSRWLATDGASNEGPQKSLPLRSMAFAAPEDVGLPGSQVERDFLKGLMREHAIRDVSPASSTFAGVMGLLQSGDLDWFHLSSHGQFSGTDADRRSALLLDGSRDLTPQDLIGAKVEEGLKAHRAFFFNACSSGRIGWGLSRLAGWAERLISSGASLFLGPLWKVDDETAARFACTFYRHLVTGQATAAGALRAARLEARRDGGVEWLAYSLYAHPNAKVRLPEAPLPEAIEPGLTAAPGAETVPA